jgi:hypothetical protein
MYVLIKCASGTMKKAKKKRGRPVIENGNKARLPSVRITHEELAAYTKAAEDAGKSFAQWVRDALQAALKRYTGK